MDYASRWNSFRKLIITDRACRVKRTEGREVECVRLDAPDGSPRTFRFRTEKTLDTLEQAAHFLVSRKLSDLIFEQRKQFAGSLKALIDTDMLRLPFPEGMMIEMEDPDVEGCTSFIWIDQTEDWKQFRLWKFMLSKAPDGQPVAIVWPIIVTFTLKHNPDAASWEDSLMIVGSLEAMGDNQDDEALAGGGGTLEAMRSTCFAAIMFACMVWRTRGMEKDVVRAPEKLNKARAKRGERPLREYTLLRIGHVYDKNDKAHVFTEGARGPMPVHWRCGHWRNQAHGARWKEHRRIWIEPKLVNFVEIDAPAPRPKFLATT